MAWAPKSLLRGPQANTGIKDDEHNVTNRVHDEQNHPQSGALHMWMREGFDIFIHSSRLTVLRRTQDTLMHTPSRLTEPLPDSPIALLHLGSPTAISGSLVVGARVLLFLAKDASVSSVKKFYK